MQVATILTDDGEQLMIDGKLQFIRGARPCGTEFEKPCIVNSFPQLRQIRLIAENIEGGLRFPHPVSGFYYDGYDARLYDRMEPYRARFVSWAENPGVAFMECDDGVTRRIPTFALPGACFLPEFIWPTVSVVTLVYTR